MTRPTRDGVMLGIAREWSHLGTCGRRRVGCVLVDADGHALSSGYNGPASGEPHCSPEAPCPGLGLPSGTGLSACEAIHAEANALIRCPDPRRVHTCYCTVSPCRDCVKLLMNTGCRRIVFVEEYTVVEDARSLWERGGREWVHLEPAG